MNHLSGRKQVSFLLAVLLMLIMLLTAGCDEDEEEDEAVETPRQIADFNKPGVVMITNQYTADISVPGCVVSPEQNHRLLNQLSVRMKRGELDSQQAVVNAYIEEIAKNPAKYLTPSAKKIRQDVKGGCMGSGFIITQDGYIVTNAHVVYTSGEDLKEMLVQDGMQQIIKKDMQGFEQNLVSQGYTVSDDLLEKMRQAIVVFYAQHLEVSNVRQQVYASLAMGSRQEGTPCEVKKKGDPAPGKDIAILKAESREGLPTVQLGDDEPLKTGDKIFVLGYPGAATFNQFLAQDGKLESSFTSGMLSAKKGMADHGEVLQIDAAITHGSSGGPVFDEKGRVIGVVTFGSQDEQGSMVQGMNFAMPVSIVKDFLKELDVQPSQGDMTRKYHAAVNAFNHGQYDEASEDFTELQEQDSLFPYVKEFLDEARKKMDDSK